MSTEQKQPNKYVQAAEAVVWFAFVAFGGLAALSLLNFIELTDQFKAVVGYAIGAFTILVLGWLAFNAVKNK
jgi:hypothetical protein